MVSVIIPNYNHAQFLKQRINSVLNQTYQNFEIIILDDCSTDDSREIIEEYKTNSKVNHIDYNITNSGSTFKQWAKGIELAKGEWIWIAESDDWCEPVFLETLLQETDQTTIVAFAQSLMISDNGKILNNTKADFFLQKVIGIDFIKSKMLLDNGIANASMCIFKKEFYFKIDKEFTEYKFCGDWLFWILLLMQGNVFISGKILNYFRKHDSDVSGKAYKNGLSYTEFFSLANSLEKRKIISAEEKHGIIKKKFKLFLYDERLDNTIKKSLRRKFYSLLNNKIYSYVLRYQANKLISKLRSSGNN